jgi:hypothetical protein
MPPACGPRRAPRRPITKQMAHLHSYTLKRFAGCCQRLHAENVALTEAFHESTMRNTPPNWYVSAPRTGEHL